MPNLRFTAFQTIPLQTWDAARDTFLSGWRHSHRNWDDAMASAWEQWQVRVAWVGVMAVKGACGDSGRLMGGMGGWVGGT